MCTNARDAMPNGGELHIQAKAEGNKALLVISDTGMGITPDGRNRLFEPYYSTKKGGSGLGLTIVNTIVSDHRGYIRVMDNKPKGTKFVIELPVSAS